MKLKRGYIQVYTGHGKGKTTAAIGLAVRALGAGLRVFMVQFMKNYPYSELNILSALNNFTLQRFGNDDFVLAKESPSPELLAEIKQGMRSVKDAFLSNRFDMIILDEICVANYFKLMRAEEVIELIQNKPAHVELILTGRYCSEEIIELADLVTTMQETRHYYQKGIPARKGIES